MSSARKVAGRPSGEPLMIVVVSDVWSAGDDLVRRLAAHGIEISTCACDELAAHLAGDRAGAVVVDGRDGLQQLIKVVTRLGGPTLSPEALVALSEGSATAGASPAPASDNPSTDKADVAVGAIALSASAMQVTVNGRSAQLRPKEVELLSYFLRHPGEVFSRSELMEAVWGYDIGDPSTVAVQVRRLREKIETDPAKPTILVTVWGAGYRLDVPESDVAAAAPNEGPTDESSAVEPTVVLPPDVEPMVVLPPDVEPMVVLPPDVEPAAVMAPAVAPLAPVAAPVTTPAAQTPSVVRPAVVAGDRSRPPGRSTPLVPLRAVDAGGPRWDGAVELARTRVYDAMARLQRRRASARIDPRVWAMIEAYASLRLEGSDVAFDPVTALAPVEGHPRGLIAHYIDAIVAAAQPFADDSDEPSAIDPRAPRHLEPLVTLDMLCHGDPTVFGRATTLDELVEAVARFDTAPAMAGPVPRAIRVALATWTQRAGRLDTPVAVSLGLVMGPAAQSTLEQRHLGLLLALGRGSELMDRAEQHVRRLRDLYVGETAASSSLKVIDLIDIFTSMPMITIERSAEVLGVSPQTVRNNVQRFEQLGWLIEAERVDDSEPTYWYAREVVEAIMLTLAEPMHRLCAIDARPSRDASSDGAQRRSAAV